MGMISTEAFKCPLCQADLVKQLGSVLHPEDEKYGVGLHCPNVECSAQEVAGHTTGVKFKDAYEVILEKFKPRNVKKEKD
jgi:hypothetical protein